MQTDNPPNLSTEEWHRLREWFGFLQDRSHPDYLDRMDYDLADKIADYLLVRRPKRPERLG